MVRLSFLSSSVRPGLPDAGCSSDEQHGFINLRCGYEKCVVQNNRMPKRKENTQPREELGENDGKGCSTNAQFRHKKKAGRAK
jgi:hypothetical protein